MNKEQLAQISAGKGFIAALDQSGGSTPKALKAYGINEDAYQDESEMFDLVHQMRSRMLTSKAMSSDRIVGVILFEATMKRKIEGLFTADYCWEKKHIVPFLKVDQGLAAEKDDCKMMKPFEGLKELLKEATEYHIFGTKMRSVIYKNNVIGIENVVNQQFEWAKIIASFGLVPIIEPEIDINNPDKEAAEKNLKKAILKHLNSIDYPVMLKLTLPEVSDEYLELVEHKNVIKVVALSGGYSQEHANELLARNHGIIASFSRALASEIRFQQSPAEFDEVLSNSIEKIYQASVNKQ